MKKFLSFLPLAALTIGLLGSCSKIDERISNLEKRVDGIESTSIASVQQQIDGIKTSINDLKAADAAINGKIDDLKTAAEAQQTLIDALKEADKALGQKNEELEGRIATLENQVATINGQIEALVNADKAINTRIDELKSYVDTQIGNTKDWAEETFATLTQYEKTAEDLAKLSVTVEGISTTLTGVQTSISGLDTKIDGIDTALQEKITDAKTELEGKINDLKTELEDKIADAISTSETSIKSWINERLEGYYTIAEVEEKIGALNTAIDAAKGTAKYRIDSLATELTALKTTVDTVKSNIRSEYKTAIDEAINKLDGEIRGALLDSIAAVNGRAEALETRVTNLENRVLAVEGNVNKLLDMIQSVSITPAYSDGSVEAEGSSLTLKCIVRPAKALNGMVSLKDSLLIYADSVKVKTKAATSAYMEIKVSEASVLDTAQGAITLKADISEYLPKGADKALTVALNIKNGISDFTTEFVPVTVVDVPVLSVSIKPAPITLEAGGTLRLAATIAPENATNKEVSWRSDDTGVATVDATGKVTAVAAGTATITVTTKDGGKTNNCSVTVTDPAPSISTIADVLATVDGGFPQGTGNMKEPPSNAWVYGSDRYSFVIQSGQNSALIFYYSNYVNPDTGQVIGNATSVLTTTEVIARDNCYTATSGNTTLIFNMTAGKLTSINFSSTNASSQENYGGTYTPSPVLPSGALAGKFTVNAEGKQVRFSKGNLIATIDASGNPTAWRFAANQYDYLGEGGANKTIGTAAGDVDLFGWSTSNNGGTSTTDNYGIKTSTSSGDYSGEFYDWGKAVDNKNTWRTLTIAEWEYLINVNGNENIRKDKYKYGVTVCTKANCLVLAPDDFAGTIEASYNATAWATAEAAGLVCLPAAGHRYGSSTIYTADHGRYWSSSVRDGAYPYYVDFYDNRVSHESSSWGYYGCSVRLITESK